MLFIGIIAACVVLGVILAASSATFNPGEEAVFGAFLGALLGVALAFMVCACFVGAAKNEPTFDHPEAPAKIISFQDHIGTKTDASAFFVLGVGGYGSHENDVTEYRFYQETGEGEFFLHRIQVDDNTHVHLKFIPDGAQPTAQRKYPAEHVTTKSWLAPFDMAQDPCCTPETWVISIPKGSMKTKFLVNEE